jgi:O-antigen/teichoic acid export membrane protein
VQRRFRGGGEEGELSAESERPESRALLARDAAKLWAGTAVEQLLGLARGVVIPRYLGPGLYGILGALGLITKYGAYLQLGITTAVGREVPYALKRDDVDVAARLARVGYSFNLFTSAVPALALAAYALATWGRYAAATSWGLVAFSFLLITSRFEVYFTTLFRAQRRFSASFAFTTFKSAALLVLPVGLLFAYGIYGVFIGSVAGGVVVMLAGSAWTRAWAGPWPDWAVVKKLLPVGLPLAGIGVLGFALQSVDRLMVIHFFTAQEVGYYMLAVTAVTFVYFVPMNVGQAMAPRIYGLSREGDRAAFEEYLVQPSLVITYLVAALGGAAVIGAVPFVRYVLPAYEAAVPVVAALLVGITCLGGAQGAAHILIALGRFRAIAAVQAVSLALATLSIGAALRFGWGLVGMAAASSAGLVLYACLIQFLAWRLMSLPARTFVQAVGYLLLPPAAVAAGLVVAFYGGQSLLTLLRPGLARPAVDIANLVLRLLLFAPTVGAFGLYVERETGFVKRLRRLIKERISPAGR